MKPVTRRSFFASAATVSGALFPFEASSRNSPEAQREATLRAGIAYPSEGVKREKIKITDVRVIPLSYVDPKRNIWRIASSIVWKTDAALCQIFTDQGIVGIGEGTPYAGPDNLKKYTEEMIKPVLIGKNPFDVDFITCGSGITPTQARDGGGPRPNNDPGGLAWAGVNNACWDIIGKALNMPVYRLLAKDTKPDPHLRIYASGGVEHEWYNNGDKALVEEALRYRKMGLTGFKLRHGTDWKYSGMTLKQYMPIMRRLREAVGPDMDLMHESVGQCMTLEEVLKEFCPLLEELRFHWFEDPIGGLEEFVTVKRAMKTVMVSGGGTMRTRFDVKPWMDSGAFDIVQTDCGRAGISENWHIARMAHVLGKYHCPHNWHGGLSTMANAHMMASSPSRHMLELNMTYNPLKEEIFRDPLVVKNGYLDLPNGPGYGVEVIPDVEKKFPFSPGSYQRPNPLIRKV